MFDPVEWKKLQCVTNTNGNGQIIPPIEELTSTPIVIEPSVKNNTTDTLSSNMITGTNVSNGRGITSQMSNASNNSGISEPTQGIGRGSVMRRKAN